MAENGEKHGGKMGKNGGKMVKYRETWWKNGELVWLSRVK